MRRITLVITSAALGVLGTLGVQAAVEPDCPTEDSCTVDYRDGAWHVSEVTP
jgi:hypothetical protein